MIMSAPTIFERIIAREIPANIVYEDELCVAFRDNNPQAPTHVLLVPRKPIPNLGQCTPDEQSLAGHLLLTAGKLAEQFGLTGGYRVVINSGNDAGQTVHHLHLHILGGRQLGWPPG
jgi:histidine triad (HIT) family protein